MSLQNSKIINNSKNTFLNFLGTLIDVEMALLTAHDNCQQAGVTH